MGLIGVAVLLYFLAANASLTQREHYALMLLLPYVLLQARLQGGEGFPPKGLRIGVALLAGLAVCIKPHFLLVPVMTAGTTAYVRRNWRLLFSLESFIGLAVFLAYIAAALFAFPQFFGFVWPLLSEVYLPATIPCWKMLSGKPIGEALGGALALLRRDRRALGQPRCNHDLDAGFIAFSIVFLVQGKGFIYHIYPAVAAGRSSRHMWR